MTLSSRNGQRITQKLVLDAKPRFSAMEAVIISVSARRRKNFFPLSHPPFCFPKPALLVSISFAGFVCASTLAITIHPTISLDVLDCSSRRRKNLQSARELDFASCVALGSWSEFHWSLRLLCLSLSLEELAMARTDCTSGERDERVFVFETKT